MEKRRGGGVREAIDGAADLGILGHIYISEKKPNQRVTKNMLTMRGIQINASTPGMYPYQGVYPGMYSN